MSKGTPSLQPLVEWDHTDNWDVITFIENEVKSSGEVKLEVDTENETYNHLRGTYVDGVEALPYASYLVSFMQCIKYVQFIYFGDTLKLVYSNYWYYRSLMIPIYF